MATFLKERQLYVMRKGVENDFFIHLVCAFEVFTFLTALVDPFQEFVGIGFVRVQFFLLKYFVCIKKCRIFKFQSASTVMFHIFFIVAHISR